MSKMSRIVLGMIGAWVVLMGLHARVNLGINPMSLFGGKGTGAAEEARFRVGFLPVT